MNTGPRLITADDAAAYMSLPRAAVERMGIGRIVLGTKVLYDRVAIDRHLDALSGLPPPSPPPIPVNDDPEAAFERSCPGLPNAARRP